MANKTIGSFFVSNQSLRTYSFIRKETEPLFILYSLSFVCIVHLIRDEGREAAARFLLFPCGLLKGALANLGIQCDVAAEVTQLPACKYSSHQVLLCFVIF